MTDLRDLMLTDTIDDATHSRGGRRYPLRTVIVGAGKAAQAREALKAMRQAELIPLDCRIDVVEEHRAASSSAVAAAAMENNSVRESEGGRGGQGENGGGQEEGRASFWGSCSMLLLRSIVGRWCWLSGGRRQGDLARYDWAVYAVNYNSVCEIEHGGSAP